MFLGGLRMLWGGLGCFNVPVGPTREYEVN